MGDIDREINQLTNRSGVINRDRLVIEDRENLPLSRRQLSLNGGRKSTNENTEQQRPDKRETVGSFILHSSVPKPSTTVQPYQSKDYAPTDTINPFRRIIPT